MTKLTCCEIREKYKGGKLPQNQDNYFFYKLLIDYVMRNNCKECKTFYGPIRCNLKANWLKPNKD